jgi:hypothetical protein
MIKNPFKFGTIVDSRFFTNRKSESKQLKSMIHSDVHIIMISPRRFGKTSLIHKILSGIERPVISLDMQMLTSEIDFAEQLLNRIHKHFPFQKFKTMLKSFRITPTISINPITGEVDVHFDNRKGGETALEDVINLLNNLSTSKKRLIVVFDEFQAIRQIGKNLEQKMRAIMQYHKDINYIFMGSQESMMRDIFEKHASPFYHFGTLFVLGKISKDDFMQYLINGFGSSWDNREKIEGLGQSILALTKCHPYYTQQLAWHVWETQIRKQELNESIEEAVNTILRNHDRDFERLWGSLINTDRKILIGLSVTELLPTSTEFLLVTGVRSTSTAGSSIERMVNNGTVLNNDGKYDIEDPFFKEWIKRKRSHKL